MQLGSKLCAEQRQTTKTLRHMAISADVPRKLCYNEIARQVERAIAFCSGELINLFSFPSQTCGLVYTELELKPTQDEDETEVTAKGCVTIYSSIQEQQ